MITHIKLQQLTAIKEKKWRIVINLDTSSSPCGCRAKAGESAIGKLYEVQFCI